MQALGDIADKLFVPTSATGDDQRVHVYVGGIALALIAYLFVLKKGLGDRAI